MTAFLNRSILFGIKRLGRMSKDSERVANYRRRHTELGLCGDCSAVIFRWGLCEKHFEAHRKNKRKHEKKTDYWARRTQGRKDSGLCYKCGVELWPEDGDGELCVNCRSHLYQPRWSKNNGIFNKENSG